MSLWFVGMLLSIVGSLAGAVGKVMMKKSHNMEADHGEPTTRSRLVFYGGLLLNVVVNPLMFILAFAFASQSLLVPLGGFAIVFNVWLAPSALGEKLEREDYVGTGVVLVGSVLVGVGADKTDITYSADDIFELYESVTFVVFALAQGAFLAALGWLLYTDKEDADAPAAQLASLRLDGLPESLAAASRDAAAAAAALASGGASNHVRPDEQLVDEEDLQRQPSSVAQALAAVEARMATLRKLAWGVAAGTVGGNQFFVKGTTSLIQAGALDRPLSWLVVLGAIVTSVAGLQLLNAGLRRYETIYVVPLYSVFLIIIGGISAQTYFHEYERYSPTQWALWLLGCSVTLYGVAILSFHLPCWPCGGGGAGAGEGDVDKSPLAAGVGDSAAAPGSPPAVALTAARAAGRTTLGVPAGPQRAREPSIASDISRLSRASRSSRLSMRMDYSLPGGLTYDADARMERRKRQRQSERDLRLSIRSNSISVSPRALGASPRHNAREESVLSAGAPGEHEHGASESDLELFKDIDAPNGHPHARAASRGSPPHPTPAAPAGAHEAVALGLPPLERAGSGGPGPLAARRAPEMHLPDIPEIEPAPATAPSPPAPAATGAAHARQPSLPQPAASPPPPQPSDSESSASDAEQRRLRALLAQGDASSEAERR